MKSAIANSILEKSGCLSAQATLREAQSQFPSMRENEPGVWEARLSGSHYEDAIDMSLTFDGVFLVKMWVRATIWDQNLGDAAWIGVKHALTQRHGDPAKWGRPPAYAGRRWTASPFEVSEIEKRRSEEGGRLLTQVILTRTFQQPGAASNAKQSLFDLLIEPDTQPALKAGSSFRERMSKPVFSKPALPRRRRFNDDAVPKSTRAASTKPWGPKWPTGRSKPSMFDPVIDEDPLFFMMSDDRSSNPAVDLKALQQGFDQMLQRSDWTPFYQVDVDDHRHHSGRWWWLGGGSMLHVFMREYPFCGEVRSKIVIHAYCGLDCPREQAVLAAPTSTELQAIVGKAHDAARQGLDPSI